MQAGSRADLRMFVVQLDAEVEPLFAVGPPRRQLVADRKISAPRGATQRHANLKFRREFLREEFTALPHQPRLESFVDAVADDVEEAPLAARRVDPRAGRFRAGASLDKRGDVDDRQAHGVAGRVKLASVYCAVTRIEQLAPSALTSSPAFNHKFGSSAAGS